MTATTSKPDTQDPPSGPHDPARGQTFLGWRRLLTMLLALLIFLAVFCALPYWFISAIYPANALPGWLGAPLPDTAVDVAIFMSPLPREGRSVYARFALPADDFTPFLDAVCPRPQTMREREYEQFITLPPGFISAPTWWTPADSATYDTYRCRTGDGALTFMLVDLSDSPDYTVWVIISFTD